MLPVSNFGSALCGVECDVVVADADYLSIDETGSGLFSSNCRSQSDK